PTPASALAVPLARDTQARRPRRRPIPFLFPAIARWTQPARERFVADESSRPRWTLDRRWSVTRGFARRRIPFRTRRRVREHYAARRPGRVGPGPGPTRPAAFRPRAPLLCHSNRSRAVVAFARSVGRRCLRS